MDSGHEQAARPPELSALGAADVHVWVLEAPEDAAPERARLAEALLSADERARMERFHFAADARRFLFAHALARTTLSRYAPGTPPERWRFRTNNYGRPEIAPGFEAAPPLRFNLSHTNGLCACAVALGRDVGVDVEDVGGARMDEASYLEIAASHFAPLEAAGLRALPAAARRARFFALWTLKEAYIKARGMGLALPLQRFAFDLDAGAAELGVQLEPDMNDDAACWRFERHAPTSSHALALAVRRAPDERLRVRMMR
jgi:4'-phosphopantetheinyl transferase